MNIRPLMLVLFMVKMSDTRRSWNADGAPRARPAWFCYSWRVLWMRRAHIVDQKVDLPRFRTMDFTAASTAV